MKTQLTARHKANPYGEQNGSLWGSWLELIILQSTMHMARMCATVGRLKSDYRYSKDIVYNNFPWPDLPAISETN